MFLKSRAFVIGSINYNDSYNIVSLFTETSGTISFLTKKQKNRNCSKNNAILQNLNLLEIEWKQKENHSSLNKIHSFECWHPYKSFHCDFIKNAITSYISEFLYFALRNEKESNPELFNYIVHALIWLDEAETGFTNFHIVLTLSILKFLGIAPNTSNYSEKMVFDLQSACYISQSNSSAYSLNTEDSEQFLALSKINISNMHLFKIARNKKVQILHNLNTYCRLHIPGFSKLKSIDILHELFEQTNEH